MRAAAEFSAERTVNLIFITGAEGNYADFIAVRFAFFVVMYAVSSVNEGKYRVLADSLNAVFAEGFGYAEAEILEPGMRAPVSVVVKGYTKQHAKHEARVEARKLCSE